jgi:hypothetical protein
MSHAMKFVTVWRALGVGVLVIATACAREPENTGVGAVEQQASAAATASVRAAHMVVHKSPTCGCCGLWVEHMQKAGFHVEVIETDDLAPVKERLGVPYGKGSCHTAEVGGYVIEGHVPAEDVLRLLAERPKARGLVLPGMPLGSPGMEMPDGRVQAYTVELVAEDGSTSAFRHVKAQP